MTEAAPVTALSASECQALLRANQVGRIALAAAGEVDIFPINYVVDAEGRIVFRTAPGTKLAELVIRPSVAFEIDGVIEGELFSVIVKGEAARVEGSTEIAQVERLPLRPWVPTVKEHFIRITPTWVTGRRFTPGPEPEIDPAGSAA
ncbi:MAG TPA: pyridoxamine 5'-phosphate oxidase family protein [Microbacteriaceae bacterium]|nr:pyridoxamine 5'-phosphate oxidase family protein [Microbacteriaceae bacterium]